MLYHVSEDNLDGLILQPRVPDNFFTKNGYENNTIARTSFAESIDKCLLAMGMNLKGKVLKVYTPEDTKHLDIISNEDLVKNNYIPDAKFTGEVWITDPVKLKLNCVIKVGEAKDRFETVSYGENEAKIYYWNYEVLRIYKDKL